MQVKSGALPLSLGGTINFTMSGNGSTSGATQNVLLQVQNMFNLKITESVTIRDASRAPDFSLPNGAQVLDLMTGEVGDALNDAAGDVLAFVQTALS